MARQSVTTQKITRAGTIPSAASPNVDGDIIDTGASVFLLLSNTGGSPATAVVVSQATFDGLAVDDLTVSLAAGATKVVGPISPGTFAFPEGDTNAGRAFVNYTGTPADIKRSVLSY
ncbi:hypothetical protein [Amycolatopsis sp. SID8362]|uniref:hypothetical protein n=1 Tax=Amycolatopsis sp. SID8362 TaxID=2690346 RepID=UPI00136E6614|nr:hypothetical protein [Amycolatopsis sp. SID8362]NBH01938.1 hypothetical protein [Amycolatopsis sp. SID8362]NED38641.1 hypothetical protein [Amycolatopsis sp. SID8362]